MNEFENLTLAGEKFVVADWEVIPNECIVQRQVANDVEQRKITPRAMEVLVYLARYSGHVISADSLLDELWNGTFTTPNAVQKCITELRHAFDDNARNPQILRTVPKRGYKLLVTPKPSRGCPTLPPQEGISSHSEDEPDAAEPSIDSGRIKSPKKGTAIVAAGVITCAIGTAGLIAWTATASAVRVPVFTVDGNSAAIVVAENDAGPLQEPGSRLHGQLLAHLGELSAGTLSYVEVPASSVNLPRDPWQANVTHVARLEVHSSGIQPEVSFHITPKASAMPSLNERLDGAVAKSQELVTHIANDLTTVLDDGAMEEMRRWGTRHVHAYQHAKLGASVRKHLTPNLLEVAQMHFERAIEADPSFASAYSALGGVLNDAWMLSEDTKSRESVRAHSQAVLRAARVNGISANVILGLEQLYGRLSAASPRDNETHWRQQLLEDPTNVEALRRYSEVLLSAGMPDASRRYLERAIALGPPGARPWFEMHFATLAGAQGNSQEAIKLCKSNVERFPDYTLSTFCLVRNLARAGDYIQAEWYLERLRESDPEGRWAYAAELSLRALKGDLPVGSKSLSAALADPRATNLARGNTCFMVGDVSCGVRYWNQIEPGMLPLLWEFNVTQQWFWADGVMEDPRYHAILDQLGMGDRWHRYVRDQAEELGSATGIAVHSSSAGKALTADAT